MKIVHQPKGNIMDNIDQTNETPDAEITIKVPFGRRIVNAVRSKTGKTVLAVAGTAGALAGTYVLGFRQGQDNVIEVLNDTDPEFEDTELELDLEVTDVTDDPDAPKA